MRIELGGARAIVTGASRGIGRAVAVALAEAGARVLLVARDDAALAIAHAALVQTSRHRTLAVDLNAADAALRAAEAAQAAWGGIDILVNNAASSKFGSFDQVTDDDWDDAYRLKLLGYVRMARAVLPAMRQARSGVIINVVGVAGRHATAGYALGAINAACLHFTRTLADTVASDGIRVLAINPGATRTDRIAQAFSERAAASGVTVAAIEDHYAAAIPLGRLGEPDEMAGVICAMASPLFSYVTGSSIFLDGGSAHGDF